jgi:hypothetical protein
VVFLESHVEPAQVDNAEVQKTVDSQYRRTVEEEMKIFTH